MSNLSYRSSKPDSWIAPRPYADASVRMMKLGPVQPMDAPQGLLSRLFGFN